MGKLDHCGAFWQLNLTILGLLYCNPIKELGEVCKASWRDVIVAGEYRFNVSDEGRDIKAVLHSTRTETASFPEITADLRRRYLERGKMFDKRRIG